ncbi:MAG: exopolysaccharide biosynthesis polyprenyl glycosylphosphotransferase, partial [Solobacterium sp.]|nr:exopolysaccharide biosynthesis polyprenyl glycosylphosphotransferase [Solobacterium sp.]
IKDKLEDVLSDTDVQTLFLLDMHSHERNLVLKYCFAHGIRAMVIPSIGDLIMSGADQIHMFNLPVLQVKEYYAKIEYVLVKRLFDIVLSAAALIVLSPLLLITALIIKLTDGGTVFYRQVRLTKDRREFAILKFRSMRMDAEKDGVARLSTGADDDRITPIGRFIRKYRIDELPQLINILKGDMSIVGPRPERPEIAALYEKELPEFALRLRAKAGLTGFAQVYGKYNTSPYYKLLLDLMYIAKPSIFMDLRIIFATVRVLFSPESTEGVASGQTTALVNLEELRKGEEEE